MGNLAKVFESHIHESSTSSSDTRSQVSSGNEKVSIKQRMVQRINISTDQNLEGIRIAEQWQNNTDLTYHALAVLDREHAGNMIRDEMNVLDRDTAFELNAMPSQNDGLKKIAAYQRIIHLQESRNSLQNTFKVIDLNGKGKTPQWNITELKVQQAKALTELRMTAFVQPDGYAGLKQQLQAVMSQAGFASVGDRADYTLLAEVDLNEIRQQQGWFWLRGTLKLRLIDVKSGVTRGSHSWALKTSATQKTQLKSRFDKVIDITLKKSSRVF